MSTRYEWLLYVMLAGLAWGTYVPLIFYGGGELRSDPPFGGRLMAILCVGIAYFVIAVVLPLALFLSNNAPWPEMKATGLTFSGLAGVMGAVGALCVVYASSAAVDAAKGAGLPRDQWHTYRIYIAPLIFGLAPVINTLVSSFWHPSAEHPLHFHMELPGWKLWLGILLVGIGAALVLFSKEEAEVQKQQQARARAAAAVAAAQPAPGTQTPEQRG